MGGRWDDGVNWTTGTMGVGGTTTGGMMIVTATAVMKTMTSTQQMIVMCPRHVANNDGGSG